MNNNIRKRVDEFSKKSMVIIGYILKIGLIIFLSLEFRRGHIELSFWLMGVSLALAGILSNKNDKKLRYISKDFIYSTFFFISSISAGGILKLFGEGISAYHVFIVGHYNLELFLTGLSFGIWGIVFSGILFGSSSFIDAILELFFINSKDDKRPPRIFF